MLQDGTVTLMAQLELNKKQLKLSEAIRRCSTELPWEQTLGNVVNELTVWFRAQIGLMYLVDRDTNEIVLHILTNHIENDADVAPAILRSRAGSHLVGNAQVVTMRSESAMLEGDWHIIGTGVEHSAEKPLGSILLVRLGQEFEDDEQELLQNIDDVLASSITHTYLAADLASSNRKIDTIFEFDRIRDLDVPFNTMIGLVLDEMIKIVGAEIGYVQLYNLKEERLSLYTSTLDELLHIPTIESMLHELGSLALESAVLIHQDRVNPHLHSVMCLPLIMNDQRIGVIGVINGSHMKCFNREDERLLEAIGSQIDTAIYDGLSQRRLKQVLGRSVGPLVMEQLLANDKEDLLKGNRRVVSILYADIRQSTELAARTPPELLVSFLNYFFQEMTGVVLAHQGMIDKFIGDEIMALFNAPLDQPDHAMRAIRTGLAMQAKFLQAQRLWRKLGVETAGMGIGIATGEVVAGEIGSELKSEYTVVGQAANLGARITGIAQANKVLVCETTYDMVKEIVEATPIGDLSFQGIDKPSTVYDILRFTERAPKLNNNVVSQLLPQPVGD